MAISQKRSRRKLTGGRYKPLVKVLANAGGIPAYTRVGELSKKVKRMRGGEVKQVALACQKANVFDPVAKKSSVVDIKTVVENPANRNFVRRNIITKGAIIETAAGKAKVTSRPGQEGVVNAILIK